MNRKADVIRLTIILAITAVLMATASITIYGVVKHDFYSRFMTNGSKYLGEGNYEASILSFTKAIKIEKDSTQARVGLARASIGVGDSETAIGALKEAQQIDIENVELMKEIINILKDVEPYATYEMLMIYANHVGEKNLGAEMRELVNAANESPQIPVITPPSGTYIKPITMKLEPDKIRVGHAVYYTLDNSEPTTSSTQYKSGIKIEDNLHIKMKGYNVDRVATDVFEAHYVIDTKPAENIKNIIAEAKKERDAVTEGTEVGNCIEGAKEELDAVLTAAEEDFNKEIISKEEADALYDRVEDAIAAFKDKIITPTDKSELEAEISKAKTSVDNATEGDEVGQYRSGAIDALNEAITEASTVKDDLLAKQEDLDEAKNKLTDAITSFEAKRVSQLDKLIADAGGQIGPVTVSLAWNTTDDLDLHVTSPEGDTVYYMNRKGTSGGYLDVDMQAENFVENPIENIYWTAPPHGTYTVSVNRFSRRTEGDVSFKIRVITDGEAKIYEASISGIGTQTVCTFTY